MWLTPRPGRFTLGKRHGAHCIQDWMGPMTGLDGSGKSRPQPGSQPRTVHPVETRYTD